MPRSPRVVLPGQPHHINHRGHNRRPIFTDQSDFNRCHSLLGDASATARCEIHAYVFMTNHLHLLVTPAEANGLARFMQLFGKEYAKCFNYKFARSGTLWEGRYHSSAIDSQRYFFECSRYIELNPVRALMVAQPAEYAWSSFHRNASGERDALVRPHPLYDALGATEDERQSAYQELFRRHLDTSVWDGIRRATRASGRISQFDSAEKESDSGL